MARALWKGAISFGLVYIPVELHSASRDSALDLDMLDRRDFSPVGYQRVNKSSGKVVDWGDIVKGYQYKKGEYVALTDEDFRQANVKASQTIEISSFTEASSIPPEFFETPYYLAPAKGGEKVYALLRETLKRTGKVAVGSLVMRSRQHPCIIVGEERVMVLNTLRFAEELRSIDDLKLPPAAAKSANVSPSEVAMAEKLVAEMSSPWNPKAYHDTYREDLMKVIEQKVRKRQTHLLTPTEKGARKEERQSAQVIDLMSVLKKSLESRGAGAAAPRRAASSRRSSTTRRRSRA